MAELSMSRAINQALDLALAADPSVIILGEDVADPAGGALKLTRGLSTKHGTARVRDTPISETAIIGAAIGAALGGLRPIAEIMFMDFLMVCMDQVANHAAKLRYMSGGRTGVPMTIRTAVAAGRSFGAQHSQSLEGWLMHTPGINVVCPSTPADAKGLLTACIEDDDPCVFMELLALLGVRGEVPEGRHVVPLGSAAVRRPGTTSPSSRGGSPSRPPSPPRTCSRRRTSTSRSSTCGAWRRSTGRRSSRASGGRVVRWSPMPPSASRGPGRRSRR